MPFSLLFSTFYKNLSSLLLIMNITRVRNVLSKRIEYLLVVKNYCDIC